MTPKNSQDQKNHSAIQISEQQISQLPMQNYISYLIFFILLIFQDIGLLISFSSYFYFIIPKLTINLCIIISMLLQAKKLNQRWINIFLLVTKFLSLLLVFLIGHDYLFIVLYILEENQINIVPLEYFLQRVFVKFGCFLLIIIYCNILTIFTVSSLLLLEIYKLIYLLQYKEANAFQNKSNSHLSNSSSIQKQNIEINWINLLQQIPMFCLLIQKNDLKIVVKSQLFYDYFGSFYKNEEELNEIILKQMTFQIVSEYQYTKQSQQNEVLKNNLIMTNYVLHNQFKNYHKFQEQNIDFPSVQSTQLYDILNHYLNDNANNSSKIFIVDIFSQYYWEENNYLTFAGQFKIDSQEDHILVTFYDISKQYLYQETKIKKKFTTPIVQSFSHELRTPLNSSLNFLQYCENTDTISEEIKRQFISPAINSLRLQSYLINDIIDFSSLCSDNLEFLMSNITMEQIIEEVNKLFKQVLEMKNLILYVDLSDNELKSIVSDFSRLMQIITNLIQNSIKYSNSGVIILKISSSSQKYLKISIEDEGFGIDEDRLNQITTMLKDVQEKMYLPEQKSWHGFGLLISSMLIKKLGPSDQQSLFIKSKGLSQGTKVTFYISNQQQCNQSSNINHVDQSIKNMHSKLRISSQSGSNQNISLNGTIIQISELVAMNKDSKLQFKNKKKSTNHYQRSSDNSVASDTLIDLEFQFQIGEFYNFYPFLFSKQKQNYQQEYSPKVKQQQTKIVSYNMIKLQEDQESEYQIKELFKKFKCNCNRILSVDDEIFNQKSIQFSLKLHGFEVILAFNGEEAINIVKETQKCGADCELFLLILMDYQMPILNGLETTKKLKQMMKDNLIPNIKVVGLTAYSRNDRVNCLNSGMATVLAKPLKIAEFFEVLKQA